MKRKWMGASLALASVGLLVGPLQSAEAATPKIKVHYIDVGQGDAIYIKMPSGEDIVMDGGNKGKGDELVAYKKNTFLFTGDAELKSEQDMIAKKKTLRADVLKVGHHGAKTSTSATFLKYVKPKYAVISVGKNAYGHPTKEVVTNLKRAKATMLRTDKSGTIVFEGNGSSYTIKKSK